jgi:hypothetical protein
MPRVERTDGPSVSCDAFEEGREGLILKDSHGRNVGWLPFEKVECVLPESGKSHS